MPAELAVTLLFHQTEELMAGGTVEVGYGLGLTIALRIPTQSSTPPRPCLNPFLVRGLRLEWLARKKMC